MFLFMKKIHQTSRTPQRQGGVWVTNTQDSSLAQLQSTELSAFTSPSLGAGVAWGQAAGCPW